MCSENGFVDEGCKECKKLEHQNKSIVVGTAIGIEQRFGKSMLPLKYKHKVGTAVLVDKDGGPVGVDNGDGTWSGLSLETIHLKKNEVV